MSLLGVDAPQLILFGVRLFHGKKYEVELRIPLGWRDARGVPAEDARAALANVRCFRAGAAVLPSTDAGVVCRHCGRVVAMAMPPGPSVIATAENCDVPFELFSCTIRAQCTSTRAHVGDSCVLGLAIGGLTVISKPFSVLARERRAGSASSSPLSVPTPPPLGSPTDTLLATPAVALPLQQQQQQQQQQQLLLRRTPPPATPPPRPATAIETTPQTALLPQPNNPAVLPPHSPDALARQQQQQLQLFVGDTVGPVFTTARLFRPIDPCGFGPEAFAAINALETAIQTALPETRFSVAYQSDLLVFVALSRSEEERGVVEAIYAAWESFLCQYMTPASGTFQRQRQHPNSDLTRKKVMLLNTHTLFWQF